MNDPTPEDVERVARTIYEISPILHIHDDSPVAWEHVPSGVKTTALAQARAAFATMPGWKPIETADRNAKILAAHKVSRDIRISRYDGNGAYRTEGDGIWWPTHWMPLPDPPDAALRKANEALGGNISTKGDENVYRD